ncbi:DMT family transporter [Algivirga pacifica]|uniref:DMT family transporter n=1 Tax=Algivirga pacifica TaxID=1162670 RepID=A0ABP9D5M8_9BACT
MKTLAPSKKPVITNKVQAVLLLLLLSLIWGSSFILIKKSLLAFTPLEVGTGRVFFGFTGIILIGMKELRQIPLKTWKHIVVAGLIGNLFPALLFAVAVTGLESSVTGILNAMTPLFTFVLGVLFFQYKFQWKQLYGLMIALAGTLLISFINANGNIGSFNEYALLVILATVLYAINGHYIKKYLSEMPSVRVSVGIMSTIGIPMFFVLLFSGFFSKVGTHPEGVSSLVYLMILGCVGTGFAVLIFNYLIKIAPVVFVSTVTFLIPIVALAWGYLDNEAFSVWHMGCMLMILSGVYLVNRFS